MRCVWGRMAVVEGETKNFTGDRNVLDWGSGYINAYIWQSLSNCIPKVGHILCKLYLNKVEFFKKTIPFHFIIVIPFWRSMCVGGGEVEWVVTDSPESGMIKVCSKFSIVCKRLPLIQEFLSYIIQLPICVLVTEVLIYRDDFMLKKLTHTGMAIIHNSQSMDSSRPKGYYIPIY